jgi:hypothetical protein
MDFNGDEVQLSVMRRLHSLSHFCRRFLINDFDVSHVLISFLLQPFVEKFRYNLAMLIKASTRRLFTNVIRVGIKARTSGRVTELQGGTVCLNR